MKSLLNKISLNQAVTRFLNGDRELMINDILSLSYLICASFYKKKQNYSIVAPNLYIAQNIYEQISAIIGEENCLLYPVDEIFYHTNYSYSKEMLAQRLYVMDKCLDGQNRILITHVNAVQRILPSPKVYTKRTITLKKNERYIHRLTNILEQSIESVEEYGTNADISTLKELLSQEYEEMTNDISSDIEIYLLKSDTDEEYDLTKLINQFKEQAFAEDYNLFLKIAYAFQKDIDNAMLMYKQTIPLILDTYNAKLDLDV